MWLRFAVRCDIAFIEGADQAYYRIHASNMTVARSPIVDLAQRAAAFESFFADCGTAAPGCAGAAPNRAASDSQGGLVASVPGL